MHRQVIATFVLALALLAVFAFVVIEIESSTTNELARAQESNASLLYENQLLACQTRGNEVRSAIWKFATAGAESREVQAEESSTQSERVSNEEDAAKYAAIANGLAHAAHAKPNGEIICVAAITKP